MLINLSIATELLLAEHVVAIPTETVYGLAASIHSSRAITQIFELKGRPKAHPLIIHLSPSMVLHDYAMDVPSYVESLLAAFSPGPLTLILKRSARVCSLVTGGQDTVGIRFPAHPLTQSLIEKVGHPLAAPSANRFGKISPTCAEHVLSEFGHQVNILDGRPCEVGIESTIVDATHPEYCTILRHGHITQEQLKTVLGKTIKILHPSADAPRVSGSFEKHYAPTKPAFLFRSAEELRGLQDRFNLLTILRYTPPFPSDFSPMPAIPAEYAKVLYDRLRLADQAATEAIAIECPPSTPEWLAIYDRLSRACYCSAIPAYL